MVNKRNIKKIPVAIQAENQAQNEQASVVSVNLSPPDESTNDHNDVNIDVNVNVKKMNKDGKKIIKKETVKKIEKAEKIEKVEKLDKPKKVKLIRDSFTIPKNEMESLSHLKERAVYLKTPIKKSELLRAGLMALSAMDDANFILSLKAVPILKTGRPRQ